MTGGATLRCIGAWCVQALLLAGTGEMETRGSCGSACGERRLPGCMWGRSEVVNVGQGECVSGMHVCVCGECETVGAAEWNQ